MRNEGGGASGIMSITLIDRNADATAPITNDEERIGRHRRPHRSIPSRGNGNYLCPSLTVPWTARPLWGEALMPGLRYAFAGGPRPPISFDWPSLIADRNMVRFLSSQDRPVVFVRTSLVGRRVERRLTISLLPRFSGHHTAIICHRICAGETKTTVPTQWSFGVHFLLQKFLLCRPEHRSNKSILEYSMKCLDDPADVLVQGIEYDRWAMGTKALDGTVHDNGDSSGDIDMFCRGLLHKLMEEYDDVFEVIPGEEATMLRVDGGGVLRGVATIDRNGERRTHEADKIVVALGANSSSLCGDIGVSCPVYPARGHLVTVASKFDHRCNLTLDGGLGYAAPMARVDHLGRRMYRLSGFVDFAPPAAAGGDGADPGRIDALVGAARSQLPDLEVVDASACHRPISADDRALVGPSGDEHPNLYLATGFGSRGWTIGLGSGKLLASMMMGVPCDIDPTPYLPSRFSLSYKGIFGTRRRAAPLM
jgi:hypothetical protein